MATPGRITEVYFCKGMGTNAASTHRDKGILYLNAEVWPTLTEDQRAFIVFHELGHIVLDTSDEFAVDEWAFDQYARAGYSLTQGVTALTDALSLTHPDHISRIRKQFLRALLFDAQFNNNKKADQVMTNGTVIFDNADGQQREDMFIGDALSIGKDVVKGLGGLFGKKKKKKAAAPNPQPQPQTITPKASFKEGAGVGTPPTAKKKNIWLWVGIGAAVLVVVGVILATRKK